MERGRDDVRVMTVHGAKGLEADIVILPDTTGVPSLATDRGNLLYTDDGVLYPLSDKEAPEAVLAAKDTARQRMLEEHRRLLYVALTRARDRLYICGFEGKTGLKSESWYALAQSAAEAVGVRVERGDETIHVLGDTIEDATDAVESVAAQPVSLPSWTTAAAPAEIAAPRLIRPSDTGDEEPAALPPQGAKSAQRFRRGLLVHALLARLPQVEPKRRQAVARKFLKGKADADSIADETLRVLDDPVFAPAFAPGSRAEVGIVADLPELGPGARVNGRIDRLAVTENAVLIVDFKTNRPPPAREADLARIYRTQMALYRAALARIFPRRRIDCALVWTEGPSLMPLSEDLLEAELRRIAAVQGGRIDVGGSRS